MAYRWATMAKPLPSNLVLFLASASDYLLLGGSYGGLFWTFVELKAIMWN